jgi:hypothetical protein
MTSKKERVHQMNTLQSLRLTLIGYSHYDNDNTKKHNLSNQRNESQSQTSLLGRT